MSERAIWVLLRGLAREGAHWGDFPEAFLRQVSAQQPAAELVVLDLPGNGPLYRQTSPSRVPDMVDACGDELRRQGRTGPYYLLAMSLGAMVTCEWADRFPAEVGAAVLINTSLRPYSPLYRRLRPAGYWKLLAVGLVRLSVRWRESKVLALTSRMLPVQEPVLDHWVELQRQHPVGLVNGLRQLLAALRYRASRLRPNVPMLLLCSRADALVDWRCSQALSRAWGVPLRLHTWAGHDLPLDDPPWVAHAVSDWLKARAMHGRRAAPRRQLAE